MLPKEMRENTAKKAGVVLLIIAMLCCLLPIQAEAWKDGGEYGDITLNAGYAYQGMNATAEIKVGDQFLPAGSVTLDENGSGEIDVSAFVKEKLSWYNSGSGGHTVNATKVRFNIGYSGESVIAHPENQGRIGVTTKEYDIYVEQFDDQKTYTYEGNIAFAEQTQLTLVAQNRDGSEDVISGIVKINGTPVEVSDHTTTYLPYAAGGNEDVTFEVVGTENYESVTLAWKNIKADSVIKTRNYFEAEEEKDYEFETGSGYVNDANKTYAVYALDGKTFANVVGGTVVSNSEVTYSPASGATFSFVVKDGQFTSKPVKNPIVVVTTAPTVEEITEVQGAEVTKYGLFTREVEGDEIPLMVRFKATSLAGVRKAKLFCTTPSGPVESEAMAVYSDGGYAASFKLPKEFYSEPGKLYPVYLKITDRAGNESLQKLINDVEKSSYLIEDKDAPVITSNVTTAPNENGWYKGDLTVSMSMAEESSGLASAQIKVGTESYTSEPAASDPETAELTRVFEQEIQGSVLEKAVQGKGVTFNFSAMDRAGNEAEKTLTIKYDNTAPVISAEGSSSETANPYVTVNVADANVKEAGSKIVAVVNGQIHEYESKENVTLSSEFASDGAYEVTVYALDAAGNKSEEKMFSFIKDTAAPVISISGVTDGGVYSAVQNASVTINEANYANAKVSIVTTKLVDGRESAVDFPFAMNSTNTVSSKAFAETGEYTITVSAVDASGNEALSKKVKFIVDTEKPVITISGVESTTYGYGNSPSPIISIKDSFYKTSEVTLTRNGSEVGLNRSDAIAAFGGTITYSEIPQQKAFDGYYTLTAKVTDIAGNESVQTVSFYVNRFGSVYTLSSDLSALKGKFVKNVSGTLSITEANVSPLTTYTAELKRDGQIVAEAVIPVSQEGGQGAYSYIYAFDPSNFEKEGAYELNAYSFDGMNHSEAKEQVGEIKFVVDRTAPIISTNLPSSGIYEEGFVLEISIKDNFAIDADSVKVTIGGKEYDCKVMDGTVRIDLSGKSGKLTIKASDLAGNEIELSKEIKPADSAIPATNGAIWLYVGIPVVIIIAAACAFLIAKKKKAEALTK